VTPRAAYIACRHLLYCAKKGECCAQAYTIARAYISESHMLNRELHNVARELTETLETFYPVLPTPERDKEVN
jgi:hypothetical protein